MNSDGSQRNEDRKPASADGPTLAKEVAVRALLFNKEGKVLLQRIKVESKPEFYITPGGRLAHPDEGVLEAIKRELREEAGFEQITVRGGAPFFSGSHVMNKRSGPVEMTEHFFAVDLEEESDQIDARRQQLTEEEIDAFLTQQWMGIDELRSNMYIIVPVNIADIVMALQKGSLPPTVDFSDPPQLRERNRLNQSTRP